MEMNHAKVPLHVQAEEAVKAMIARPEYQDGKLLPNEMELAEMLHVSRNTLRQAINKLVFEGRLARRKGYGTWVVRKTVTSGVRNWRSFSQEMQEMGISVRNYELHVSTVTPPEAVRHFFGMKDNALCLKLERVRGHEEFPFVVFISYFNPKLGIHADDNFTMPLYELLEKEYGVTVHTSVEELSAGLAGTEVAGKLRISAKDPILVRKRSVYDTEGVPVEYNIGYYRADSFTYTLTAER